MINNQRNQHPDCPPPSEPSVVKQAAELRNWLETLDSELVTLHEGLFAPLPEKEPLVVTARHLSLEDLISQAYTSAAQAVGFVRTVNNRLGFSDDCGQQNR